MYIINVNDTRSNRPFFAFVRYILDASSDRYSNLWSPENPLTNEVTQELDKNVIQPCI